MPIVAAPYVPRPYVSDRLIRLSDLGRDAARVSAQRIMLNGERTAQAWRDVGNAVAAGLGAVREERELVPLREAAARKLAREEEMMRREDETYREGRAAKLSEAQMLERLGALQNEYQGQRIPKDVLLKEFPAAFAADLDRVYSQMFPEAKEKDPIRLGEGDVLVNPQGGTIASNPKPAPQPKLHPVTVPGPDGRPVSKLFTEEQLQSGVQVYQAPEKANAEPLVAIMGPDGNPVLVPRSQAVGKRPASNREQGRAVTSGDAGRIADLDTSLDDLGVLSNALAANGSTGTMAKIGAAVPNWVTEYTGWGSDPKKKQALIDRVKQVIGKALEGGVLRKEDEIKYEKILPTIGDPNEQVVSKLQGLSTAIKLRRTRTIEALADAGYDTSKFGEYTSPLNNGTSAVPDLSDLPKGRGRKFTSGPFAGQTWAKDAQGKPYKVGG